MVKQQGALLAKGRLLGIQFDTLFTDDLYTRISKNAIETAMKLKRALQEKGYQLFLDSPTNQQFVVLENKKKEELAKKFSLISGKNMMRSYSDPFCYKLGNKNGRY